MVTQDVQAAYRHCMQLTRSHYENFPVASRLLPKSLRQPISAIYAYARMADDIADEGKAKAQQRTDDLAHVLEKLKRAKEGQPGEDPIFIAISDTLQQYPTLFQPLCDLLVAFNMDVTKNRYEDFDQVLEYCRHSANPIGRMLLILYKQDTPELLVLSDKICTALQLINFLQDLFSDITTRDRNYLPQDEMVAADISEVDLTGKLKESRVQQLLLQQTERIQIMMIEGASLGDRLPGRIGLELRMVVLGGWKVLQKVMQRGTDIDIDIKLQKSDWTGILLRSLRKNTTLYLQKQQTVLAHDT